MDRLFSGYIKLQAPLRYLCFLIILTSLVQAEPLDTLAKNTTGSQPLIRNIRIELLDVFDGDELAWFYRAANSLKVNTKEYVVRRELLFKEGDHYDEFLIAESERNLRALPFLRKISITPLPDGNVVDIVVRVQDTWTIFPFFSFTSGGGTEKRSAGIAETNLLGFGKRIETLYADDEGREKIEAVWDDRRFLGSYHQITQGVFKRSDGYRALGFYGRPFRSLVEKYSWSLDTDFSDLVDQLYEGGDTIFAYREKRQAASGGFTVASGDPQVDVMRYTLGYDYSSSQFEEADDEDLEDADIDLDNLIRDPALIAVDRKFSGPYLALQKIEPDFVSMNFIDRFERVEDFNLGREFFARLTLAADALGSTDDTLLLVVNQSDGHRFSPTSFVRGRIGLFTRATADEFDNTVIGADLRYYNVLGAKYLGGTYIGKHTLVASVSCDLGFDLDRDKQVLLGASSGLRGYEDRALTGSQKFLMNFEDRAYLVEDLYKLISLGTAFFLDVGGTSTQGLADIWSDELRADVGLGLRFGFPRSSGGSVLRVDLAFPMRSGPDGTEAWEPRLLITTSQGTTAHLPAESQQTQGSNVTVRFIP